MLVTQQIQYRLFQDKDLDGILKLWASFSGWGSITPEQFNDWYINTPGGQCIIVVMTDHDDEVVGKIVLIPFVCYHYGQELKCLKLSAPIIHPQFRRWNLKKSNHPIYEMLRFGLSLAKKGDYKIVYTLPVHGWLPMFKSLPNFGLGNWHTTSYPCVSISLKTSYANNGNLANNNSVQQVVSFNKEHEALWKEAISLLNKQCAISREVKWLSRKLIKHLVLEVRENQTEKLIGYVAIKKQTGLIVDVLARTKEDGATVMQSVIKTLRVTNNNRITTTFSKLTIMQTSYFDSFLKTTDYDKLDFMFAFGCTSLDSSVDFDSIHPDHWHIMPED